MMHLLTAAKPGLRSTFFSLVFMQPSTEALLKNLTSGSVHAGELLLLDFNMNLDISF